MKEVEKLRQTVTPLKEGMEAIKEAGGRTSNLCYQCGTCNTACPWNIVSNFNIRKIVRQAQFGLPRLESEEIWSCTTCGNCVQGCPRGVKLIDIGVSIRRIASEWGTPPAAIRRVRTSLAAEGNPWGEERRIRGDWAKGLPAPKFTEGKEILYFPCCLPSYDSRLRKVAIATANILNKAGVDFGILGSEENCCGESIRKAGAEAVFRRLAKDNIKTFIENWVKKIVVSSPHCYQVFKNEYTDFGVRFEIIHMSQYLAGLIDEGRLKFTKQYPNKVVYHDPCYLGRHNNIYDEPREVLKRIPGIELVEFADSRQNSLCCGGGGGRIWMDTPRRQRFSDLRLKQAIDVGARVLATSCPYCILNFDASRLTVEGAEGIEIKDITEIVQEVI